MFRVVIVFLLLFSLPAAAGSPQERARRKWWTGTQAQELGLTNEQSRTIESIHQQAFPRIEQGVRDLDGAQKELNQLIVGDKTTEMDVVRQINIVQAARNELNRQFVLMLYRQYRELRADQRAKLKAMQDRERRRQEERREGRRDQPPQRPPINK